MDYLKEYKKFITSYNFYEAIRITIGVVLPAVVMSFLGLLPVGLVIALGAMTTSGADLPGPIHHRLNSMAAAGLLSFLIVIIVGFAHVNNIVLGLTIGALCFVLSMLGVYGARVNAVGFAGLIIMVLNLQNHPQGWGIILNALYVVAGCLWYILFSFTLISIRPYKFIQQALGDSIYSIGDYYKIRAAFYDPDVDYDDTYKKLMQKQEEIQEKHIQLREILFKSRHVIKESTVISRTLIILFVESIDLFERGTATLYNYEAMHKRFDNSGILLRFRNILLQVVAELHEIGLAVQSSRSSHVSPNLSSELETLKTDFEKFIDENRSPENLEPLLNLRKVMQSIEDIITRIQALHHYTRYDEKRIKDYTLSEDLEAFVSPTNINPNLFIENLSLTSNTFRHALRVSIAALLGFTVSHLLQLGQSYWVLLTILVILKPSYSLTKSRNKQRLIGTIIGACIGVGLLYIIPSSIGRFIALVILIMATYSFLKTKYLVSVVFMTAYVLIFFFILNSKNFIDVLENRLIDTVIGSVIALVIANILAPNWEREQIKDYMAKALDAATNYFKTVSGFFVSAPFNDLQTKLSRRDSFVALANLSGAFSRMMNEPKDKQVNIKRVHQFVVMIYTLNSHTLTLSHFAQTLSSKYRSEKFTVIMEDITSVLTNAAAVLHEGKDTFLLTETDAAIKIKNDMELLVAQRQEELRQGIRQSDTRIKLIEYKPIIDQFLLIRRICGDINRLCQKLVTEDIH